MKTIIFYGNDGSLLRKYNVSNAVGGEITFNFRRYIVQLIRTFQTRFSGNMIAKKKDKCKRENKRTNTC